MRTALLLALLCVSPGCDFFDDDSGDGTWVAYDEVASVAKDAYCRYATRCGIFPDEASCASSSLSSAYSFDVDTVAGIRTGTIHYNGSNMRKCLDAIALMTCDRTDEDGRVVPPACSEIIQGLGKSGDACFVGAECASTYCNVNADTSVTCATGTCIGDTAPETDPVPLGMPCGSTTECEAGTRCDFQTTLTCVPLKAQGAPCVGDQECAFGLGCGGTAGTRACTALPTLNQACSPDLPCRDDGQYCDVNMTTPTCRRLGLEAATCIMNSQCSLYYPCDTTTGKCTKLPTTGQSCVQTGRCFDAASYCDTATYLCTALKGDGSMCTADTQCASHNCDTALTPALCTTETGCY